MLLVSLIQYLVYRNIKTQTEFWICSFNKIISHLRHYILEQFLFSWDNHFFLVFFWLNQDVTIKHIAQHSSKTDTASHLYKTKTGCKLKCGSKLSCVSDTVWRDCNAISAALGLESNFHQNRLEHEVYFCWHHLLDFLLLLWWMWFQSTFCLCMLKILRIHLNISVPCQQCVAAGRRAAVLVLAHWLQSLFQRCSITENPVMPLSEEFRKLLFYTDVTSKNNLSHG